MIKEILLDATAFLQLNEVNDAIFMGMVSTGSDLRPTVADKPHLNDVIGQLMQCVNLVISEVATHYHPLRITESAASRNGRIDFNWLSNRVIEVLRVMANGGNVKFEQRATGIVVASGAYDVEYTYVPPPSRVESQSPFGSRISSRVLALGVVREYCIINNMLEEAAMWDKRFLDEIVTVAKPSREIKLPLRRWK